MTSSIAEHCGWAEGRSQEGEPVPLHTDVRSARPPAEFEKRRSNVIQGAFAALAHPVLRGTYASLNFVFDPFLCRVTKKWTRHSHEAAGEIIFFKIQSEEEQCPKSINISPGKAKKI